jgi:hypothetical protein
MGNKKHNKKKDYSKRRRKSKSFDKVFVCSFNYFGCLDYDPLFIVLKNDNHDGTGNRT